MIFDALESVASYKTLNPRFAQADEFLSQPDLAHLAPGRHEIDGEDIFAIVVKGLGRKPEEGQLEIHRRYLDIQVVLDGTDQMGWKPTAACASPATDYDPTADVQLFTDRPEVWLPVGPSQMAIFFPHDAHLPMISSERLHKVIIKVAI